VGLRVSGKGRAVVSTIYQNRVESAGPRCGLHVSERGSPSASTDRTAGEEDAHFYLRKLGYIIVARNYRSHRSRGEIDLIGWDQDVLCFIEVKTRTSHDVKPAEAAVDPPKRRELSFVARDYLRRLPPSCQWRFDIVSVYYEERQTCRPKFELFKNAFRAS
jgi:putative endonuclease